MTMTHKKQHWIPRSYLAAWCDLDTPDDHTPYVWRFAKDGESRRRKAPKNIFHEKDLYTIHLSDGSRELALEHGLAELEGEFVRIRDDVLSASKTMGRRDHLLLCAYVGAMMARGVPHLNHWTKQFREALERIEEFRESMLALTPEERARVAKFNAPSRSNPSCSYEDFKKIVEGPVAPWVASMIEIQLPWLARMQPLVLTTDDNTGFITSDRPCMWFDPEAHRRPWPLRSPGLATPTIEITLPISPAQVLVLTYNEDVTGYCPVPLRVVDALNRRMRLWADQYVIVNRDATKDVWFAPNEPAP